MNKVNPFYEKGAVSVEKFVAVDDYALKAYNKETTDPYTKTRIILLNGAEYEQTWFLHQMHRRCSCNDIRRDISLIRRHEQHQQKMI